MLRYPTTTTLITRTAPTTKRRRISSVTARSRVMDSAMTRKQSLTSLNAGDIEKLVTKSKDWAYLNGLVVRTTDLKAVIHAPIAVLPSSFPQTAFQLAVDVMPVMNLLYDAISQDSDFLQSTLASAAEFDDFTARLLKIHSEVKEAPKAALGIHRSDYMLDQTTGQLLQVEMNTMASSFGCLATQVSKLHSFMMSTSDLPQSMKAEWRDLENSACEDIVDAMAAAHELMSFSPSAILMLVDDDDTNRFDQQWLSVKLAEKYGIEVIRKPIAEMLECSHLDGVGNLVVEEKVISLVYLRSAYAPRFYTTENEWEARLRIERSSAIKCPSIRYHLAGTKKIQQELAKPGVLERFLPSKDADRVRGVFAGLWGLDDLSDDETKAIVQRAIDEPDNFVLKPQREGGGNNLYGDEMVSTLVKGEGLSAFILMQLIQPPLQSALLLRNNEYMIEDSVSELGIYGTFLRSDDKILLNQSAGHLLRTKASTANEGGVASGFAVIDSPYLKTKQP